MTPHTDGPCKACEDAAKICDAEATRYEDQGQDWANSACKGSVRIAAKLIRSSCRHQAREGYVNDPDCICRGNWRLLVKECEGLIGKKYQDKSGKEYTFYGLVLTEEDYYYGMYSKGDCRLLSCVGDLQSHGFTLLSASGREGDEAAKLAALVEREANP